MSVHVQSLALILSRLAHGGKRLVPRLLGPAEPKAAMAGASAPPVH